MAIKAVNLAKTKQYESDFDDDKGTEQATKWLIGAIDTRLLSLIKDKSTAIPMSVFGGGGDGMASLRINEMNFDVVCYGLKAVSNFETTYTTTERVIGGKKYVIADPDFVATIPDYIIDELATAILEINTITETERKNSEE